MDKKVIRENWGICDVCNELKEKGTKIGLRAISSYQPKIDIFICDDCIKEINDKIKNEK